MYSTKTIEKILLAELSRNQYNSFMQDVKDSSDLSYKEIKNIRNSETFRKIFGNKQRIWIPLDVENTIEEPLHGLSNGEAQRQILIINAYLYGILFAYYGLPYIDSFGDEDEESIIDVIYNIVRSQFEDRYTMEEQSQMYITGRMNYIDYNGKERKGVKIAGFITKLIDMYKKLKIDETNKNYQKILSQQSYQIKYLQRELNRFLVRKDSKKSEFTQEFIEKYDKPLDNKSKTTNKLYICISRYPADVAAMSTNQGWISCQNLDKDNTGGIEYDNWNWHVKYDISLGTCVAYLISEMNIKKSQQAQQYKTSLFPLLSPIARILIKPYYSINGEVYLSIGTIQKIYGMTSNRQLFINTVNQFLEDKQSDISGDFRIPKELYNENIGEANTVTVENGQIVGTSGRNDMIKDEDNVNKVRKANTYYVVYNKVLDNYIKSTKNPRILITKTIKNKSFNNGNIDVSYCRLMDCVFDNLSLNIIDDYHIPMQTILPSIFENMLGDMSQKEFEKQYKSKLDKNKIINNIDKDLIGYINYIQGNTTLHGSAFDKCKFNDCNNIKSNSSFNTFNECKFNNSNIEIFQRQDDYVTYCDFKNCSLFVTHSLGKISNCNFDNCSFIYDKLNIFSKYDLVFENCSFVNCSTLKNTESKEKSQFKNKYKKDLSIKFINSSIDGTLYNGEYQIQGFNFDINADNLIKIDDDYYYDDDEN